MKEKILQRLTKYHYYSFLLFLTGYTFSLSNSDINLYNIIVHISDFSFAFFNILYFVIMILIMKSLLKNYKYFEATESFSFSKNSFIYLKTLLLGYFIGSFTLLGNVFIKVLFVNILG